MPKRVETTDTEPPLQGNQGICVHCRRLLPASSFMRDSTGNLTAWCRVCREEAAGKWDVDPRDVELMRALYVFEQSLKREAEAVMLARINLNQAQPGDLVALNNRIHGYHAIRHSRIPGFLRETLKAYRERWYTGVQMDAPDITLSFPAPSNAVP
jgi:hypothetical protein